MTEDNGDENLQSKTETYFCRAISVNRDYAVIILRSCLALLPEAEETALLASRCIEALGWVDGVDDVNGWIDDVKTLAVDEFQMIADSLHDLFTRSHDILYKIVDVYLKEHNEKITEEEKTRICSSVDCDKLSSQLIMHAVQNPRMPLRFIVRAMLVEQFTTRDSIFSTLAVKNHNHYYKQQPHHHNKNNKHNNHNNNEAAITLGMILRRDAALRQAAQLKASVEATSSKIESLEREVINMKRVLNNHYEKNRDHDGAAIESGRSLSLRFSSSSENKIERGERGSTSLLNFRFSTNGGDQRNGNGGSSSCSSLSSSSSERSTSFSDYKRRNDKSLGWRLMNGLKSAFGKSSSSTSTTSKVPANGTYSTDISNRVSKNMTLVNGDRGDHVEEDAGGDGVIDVFEIQRDRPSHRRRQSFI